MKKGAALVNMSRGGLVDPAALDERCASGHLSGAVIDVTYPEPPPADWPYWDTPNLMITPHVLSDDIDAYVPRTLDIFFGNLRRHFAGEPLTNLVDLERQYYDDAGRRRSNSAWCGSSAVRQAGDRHPAASTSRPRIGGRWRRSRRARTSTCTRPTGRSGSTRCAATPAMPSRYTIAVKREPAGRGGSRSMHDSVEEGERARHRRSRATTSRLPPTPPTACSSPAASASRRSTR